MKSEFCKVILDKNSPLSYQTCKRCLIKFVHKLPLPNNASQFEKAIIHTFTDLTDTFTPFTLVQKSSCNFHIINSESNQTVTWYLLALVIFSTIFVSSAKILVLVELSSKCICLKEVTA